MEESLLEEARIELLEALLGLQGAAVCSWLEGESLQASW